MIFLTGGTGFLGTQLVGRLLMRCPDQEIGLLVRPTLYQSAEERVRHLITELFGAEHLSRYVDKVRVIPGDLSEADFGLGDSEFRQLSRKVRTVFHSAATTTLNLALEDSRRINVCGTENVLHLSRMAAQNFRDFRLHHISTAYVAGDTTAVVGPSELNLSRAFRNSYEQSKAEAEALVRAASKDFSATIYRPSIIVGDSVTGQTSAFNVLYVPAKLLIKGIFKVLPGVPDTPFDIVPVDYVADSIVELSLQVHPSGCCFHLCAGVGRESTPREVLELLFQTFQKFGMKGLQRFPKPHFVSPEMFALAQASLSVAYEGVRNLERIFHRRIEAWAQTFPFVPYMTQNPRFDTSSTIIALPSSISQAPLFQHYAERVFRYCVDTNWGKIPWTNPANLTPWVYRHGVLPSGSVI